MATNYSNSLLYGNVGAVDKNTGKRSNQFLDNMFKNQKVDLNSYGIQDAINNLKNTTYTGFDFTKPNYDESSFATNGQINSVADLPPAIKDAIFSRLTGNINKAAATQKGQATDALLRMGKGKSGNFAAVMRDINKSQMGGIGDAAIQQMIEDAQRQYQEQVNLRQMNMENARYKTGLDDMLQTRQAAEKEKEYQSKYGQAQDVLNTTFNRAAFQSGENANQASREQAGVTQGLNYLGQAGSYGLNVQQLDNKKPVNTSIVGNKTGTSGTSTSNPQSNAGGMTYNQMMTSNNPAKALRSNNSTGVGMAGGAVRGIRR